MKSGFRIWVFAFLFFFMGTTVHSATIEVELKAKDGQALRDAVIGIYGDGLKPKDAKGMSHTVIQKGEAFVPRVSAVSVGTDVKFENKDNFNHHVYSVSKTKSFRLPLYSSKDPIPPPEKMDKEGLVVVGCNIHDHMVGYIYVLGTSKYQISTGQKVRFSNLGTGTYQVRVWHPQQKKPNKSVDRSVSLNGGKERKKLVFSLPILNDVDSKSDVDDLFSDDY